MHSSVSHPIPLAATRNTQNTSDVGHQITGGPLYSPLLIYCPGSGGGGAGGDGGGMAVVWSVGDQYCYLVSLRLTADSRSIIYCGTLLSGGRRNITLNILL